MVSEIAVVPKKIAKILFICSARYKEYRAFSKKKRKFQEEFF